MRNAWALCVFLGLVAIVAGSCRRQPPSPPPPAGLSNPSLGIQLVAVPVGWMVEENDARGIELHRTIGGEQGRLRITVSGPRRGGVNLVEAVKQRQREIEAQGGTFYGSKELRTPFGRAYTARGSYKTVPGEVEELTVFALHPTGQDRMLTLTYTYPAGSDTRARAEELFDVLAQIDRLAATPPPKG